MTERDSKSIARRWNREIDDEIRRDTARQNERGPWRAFAWGVLWLLWLVMLVAVVASMKS